MVALHQQVVLTCDVCAVLPQEFEGMRVLGCHGLRHVDDVRLLVVVSARQRVAGGNTAKLSHAMGVARKHIIDFAFFLQANYICHMNSFSS